MTPEERAAELEAIAAEVRVCTRCRLHETRTRAVPGEGHPDTEVVLVGEGPGYNEDQQGRPFVGAAGGLLNDLLGTVGWSRPEVFITNVVKCRPPGNRDPEPDEIGACRPYLRRQLEVLDPALVVTLGRYSLGTFIPGARIGEVHGRTRPIDPETGARDATAFAMYHPAAAFRQMALKETLFHDMLDAPQALIDARQRRQPAIEAAEPAPVSDVAAIAAEAAPVAEAAPTPAIAAAAAEPPVPEALAAAAVAAPPSVDVAPRPATLITVPDKVVAAVSSPVVSADTPAPPAADAPASEPALIPAADPIGATVVREPSRFEPQSSPELPIALPHQEAPPPDDQLRFF